MKIKLSHTEIGLQRIAKVTQVRSDVAKIRLHTGESIHVRLRRALPRFKGGTYHVFPS